MKARELQNLLNRAAAALETPGDLSDRELVDLIEDLTEAAKLVPQFWPVDGRRGLIPGRDM